MNANNGVKLDNLGLFNEVDKFVSIKKDKTGSTKYEFINLTSDIRPIHLYGLIFVYLSR